MKTAIEAAAIWEPVVTRRQSSMTTIRCHLVRSLGTSEPFPIARAGRLMGAAVAGLVEITQAPVALCASSVLAAAALGTQAHADVVLPIGAGQRRPLSFYFGSVAVSGERKSTVDREVLAPVRGREAELREVHASEKVAHEARLDAWQKERKSILSNKELGQVATEADLKALGPLPRLPSSPI